MSQIEELQGRIAAAMDRIGASVATMSQQTPADPEPDPALVQALEDEKLASAQLEERLRTLRQKHEEELARLQARLSDTSELDQMRTDLDAQADATAQLDMDVQRLRQANDRLRESNAALRQANEAGVGEPHLINKAMLAELEGLRAVRATDAAEASAVLAKLEPLLAVAGVSVDAQASREDA